ncbi:hypothetical protein BJ165DRAFT_1535851 [Panaeolus papilionaceus]|nr:hypothetical protein BJ165DRAFT_1535851 [Panaeolus papilionaceus]
MLALTSLTDSDIVPGILPPQSGYSSHVNAFKILYQMVENAVFVSNFHVAIIHLSYLQEEHVDRMLPDWDSSFSLKMFTCIDDSRTSNKDPDIIKAHGFRLLLHLAVLISPVFLLSLFRIFKYTWERDSLLEYSLRLGNSKLEILLRIEKIIWKAFFSAFKHETTLQDAMHHLVKEIPWDDLARALPRISCLAPGTTPSPVEIGEQMDIDLLHDIEQANHGIVNNSSQSDPNDAGMEVLASLGLSQNQMRAHEGQLGECDARLDNLASQEQDSTHDGGLNQGQDKSSCMEHDKNDTHVVDVTMGGTLGFIGDPMGKDESEDAQGSGEAKGDGKEKNNDNRDVRQDEEHDDTVNMETKDRNGGGNSEDKDEGAGVGEDEDDEDNEDTNTNEDEDNEDANTNEDEDNEDEDNEEEGKPQDASKEGSRLHRKSLCPKPHSTASTRKCKPGNCSTVWSVQINAHRGPKTNFTDPIKILKRELATIKEAAQRRWTQTEDITLCVVPAPKNYSLTMGIVDINGCQRDIQLDFHEAFICHRVGKWHKAVEDNYVIKDGVPQPCWLAEPATSVFAIMDYSDLHNVSLVQHTLQELKQNIVVKNIPGKRQTFNLAALQEVQRVDHPVDIHDHLIKCGPKSLGKRLRSGTLGQVLECAYMENGKILNALDLPMRTAMLEESCFMTDLVSWRMAMGELNCPRGKEFPISKLRWALVTTKGGVHWVHIDNDSFATFLHIRTGAKWWIIAMPKEGVEDTTEFIHLQKGFDASIPCPDLFTYEAFLLTEDTMLLMWPNTQHIVITVDHTIVAGGYFYNTTCLTDTIRALVHCFNTDGAITNSNTPASRPALQHILSFFYASLIKQGIHHQSDEFQHLPILESASGCQDFLVACLIGITMILFNFKAYVCGAAGTIGFDMSSIRP